MTTTSSLRRGALRLDRVAALASLLALGCTKGNGGGAPSEGVAAEAQLGQRPSPGTSASTRSGGPGLAPLEIGYSDWPGFVAWEIAKTKGWFAEAGLNVQLVWFEYVPSLDAFQAGRLDAVGITNGDQLVIGSSGTANVMIIINDYSNGNDMLVARRGIASIAELRGKSVGVEVGFVPHLLLINALKAGGLGEGDVKLVNVTTDQTPQALASGKVDAIAAWQPSSGNALRTVAGSKALFTSRDAPGIIYDGLTVKPSSLSARRGDWIKLAKVWFRVVAYLRDPKNRDDVMKIMSARVNLTPEQYAPLLEGTFFLDRDGNLEHQRSADSLMSIEYSSRKVDEFNVRNKVYEKSVEVKGFLDPSIARDALP